MTGASSRRKGLAGEREAASFLRSLGIAAERTSTMYETGADAPDVLAPALPIHLEVKRTERLALWPAVEQARFDARGRPWAILHRANRRPWVGIVDAAFLVELLKKNAPGCPQTGSEGDTHTRVRTDKEESE